MTATPTSLCRESAGLELHACLELLRSGSHLYVTSEPLPTVNE